MKRLWYILIVGLLLVLGINGKDNLYHPKEEWSCKIKSDLSGSMQHITEREEVEFALSDKPMQMTRQENVRSVNHHRTVSQRNHHNTNFHSHHQPHPNNRSKSVQKNDALTKSVLSSDYGRVGQPISLRLTAVEHYIFSLHHILI